ncbi:acyltransferase family protein [Uliginosibacterium gangwonense]|uniref:acyltransferase family protein n=1 Tax=Uliginosibacterium gangwonense TaxID=392736 RepID=UPI000362E818|nr:acyltransferase family protein [Uliginosibacterium gangwonense]
MLVSHASDTASGGLANTGALRSELSPSAHAGTDSTYRPDIDGLRAVAILSVILFHAFPRTIGGGFVGVDVFFVISGYLISKIIFSNLADGSFSFLDFYFRRIKRIFPALLVVIITSLVVGWFFLVPNELKLLGKHAAAGSGFVQNFALWGEAGYFDSASEQKPLMHLWSLAVEEQFYVLYPLLMWCAWRFKHNILLAISTLALLSFGANVYLIRYDVSAAFFLPQARFWELMIGGWLAYVHVFRRDFVTMFLGRLSGRQHIIQGSFAALGLVMIIASVVLFRKRMYFPGWLALFPTIGAFLIICAGPQAWVNRVILSSRIMCFFGKISYPLYMWHWPVLSFLLIVRTKSLPPAGAIVVLAICVLLAWLTYRFVEYPIRFGTPAKGKGIALGALLAMACVVGCTTFNLNGFPYRIHDEQTRSLAEVTDVYSYFEYNKTLRAYVCHSVTVAEAYANKCIVDSPNSVFIWGDSYAAALFSGLNYVRKSGMLELSQLTDGNGPPFFREDVSAENGATLYALNSAKLELVKKIQPRVILISWMVDGANGVLPKEQAVKDFSQTIQKIKNACPHSKIVVVGPVPKWRISLTHQLVGYYFETGKTAPNYMQYGLENEPPMWDAYFKKEIPRLGVTYISVLDLMCTADGCLTKTSRDPKSVTAIDSGHLTREGSIFLAERIKEQIFNP